MAINRQLHAVPDPELSRGKVAGDFFFSESPSLPLLLKIHPIFERTTFFFCIRMGIGIPQLPSDPPLALHVTNTDSDTGRITGRYVARITVLYQYYQLFVFWHYRVLIFSFLGYRAVTTAGRPRHLRNRVSLIGQLYTVYLAIGSRIDRRYLYFNFCLIFLT